MLWYYMTGNVQELRLKPGDRVEPDSKRLFIVRRGTGQVVRDGPGGHDILLRVVREGAVVVDGGALMAETPLDVVAIPRKRG
jgi:hypothetical protein